MDDILRMRLVNQLSRDEGRMKTMYKDSVGVWTIGVGHNLEARGISDRAMDVILGDDLESTERDVLAMLPRVANLSPARQGVIFNMAFNLGRAGLLGFSKMLSAVWEEDWERAATEMLASRWAHQVGPRAHRLAKQMVEDTWQ